MATTITTGKPACYAGGTSGASYVVGYESKQNRVVRYTFTTDSGGASNVSVLIPNYSKSDDTGSSTAPLRWYIGSSSTDHANAGADSTYNGTLTMTASGGYYNFSGTASVVLTPNTTYYLWIFPGSTTYGWWWVASGGTATITVNTAAMSSMSVGNGTLGTAQTISITRHSDSFTHTLYYRYGSNSYTQIASGVATSYSWTPPLSLASYATSATSFQLTILCRTYNGSTAIGDVTSTITLTIPDTVKPSVSTSVTDPKGYLSTYGAYVQGQSGVKVTLTETTAYGSSIVSRKITVGSTSGSSTSLTVQPISASGSVTVSVSVTDARGRTGSATSSITVLAYTSPKASVSGQRCTSDGTADPAGAYIKVTYSGSYTPLNSKNTASATLYYRKSGASSWTSQSVSLSGSTVIATDAAYAYELQYAVKDNFSTQKTQTFQVGSAYVGMSLAKNADGVIDAISFGGTAHAGGGFVCEMDAVFNDGLTVAGTLTLTKTTDVAGAANNSPALIVGGAATTQHLELDGNEIMSKANGTTTSELYLNDEGGQVVVGTGGLKTNGGLVVNQYGIELYHSTPFIDFHYGSSTADYTARIIENSSGALTVYNSISNGSDKRLKKDVADLPNGYIDLIRNLHPRTYRFIKGDDYPNAGLIAQEVIAAAEKLGLDASILVRGTGEHNNDLGEIDYYSLDYNGLVPMLISCIQDIYKRLDDITERLQAIEQKIASNDNKSL